MTEPSDKTDGAVRWIYCRASIFMAMGFAQDIHKNVRKKFRPFRLRVSVVVRNLQ